MRGLFFRNTSAGMAIIYRGKLAIIINALISVASIDAMMSNALTLPSLRIACELLLREYLSAQLWMNAPVIGSPTICHDAFATKSSTIM